jgi:hypothetical protein
VPSTAARPQNLNVELAMRQSAHGLDIKPERFFEVALQFVSNVTRPAIVARTTVAGC